MWLDCVIEVMLYEFDQLLVIPRALLKPLYHLYSAITHLLLHLNTLIFQTLNL